MTIDAVQSSIQAFHHEFSGLVYEGGKDVGAEMCRAYVDDMRVAHAEQLDEVCIWDEKLGEGDVLEPFDEQGALDRARAIVGSMPRSVFGGRSAHL